MKKVCVCTMLCMCMVGGVFSQESDALYQARVASKASLLKLDGKMSLWITDADTGRPIEGARVAIEDGGIITTDSDGLAIFSVLKDGTHNFLVEKNGYIMLEDTFDVILGTILFNKFSIPPTMPLKQVKIVLDWAANPADLDLHLEKLDVYHVSYRDMQKSADGNAWLDRDDTNGYGPETITISEVDTNATYRVYVQDYTNRNATGSVKISASYATVRIYIDNRLANTVTIAQSKRGTKWNAFDIVQGVIKPVNTVVP